MSVEAADGRTLDADVIVPCTGFRPDLDILRELRLDLDPAVEAPSQLGPLIDPEFHSCGTVQPHGAKLLAHPEKDFYIVGMKSYGRAPTFLLATGYEQVRSVAAALAGDQDRCGHRPSRTPRNRGLLHGRRHQLRRPGSLHASHCWLSGDRLLRRARTGAHRIPHRPGPWPFRRPGHS